MTTTGAFTDVVSAAVRALYDQAKLDLGNSLYGRELVVDYSPDVPAEQLSSISGPGYGQLTIEGQQYGSNELFRGYPVTLAMRKYTSELQWTEEDIHWLKKQPSSKRASTFNSIVRGAVSALNGNINLDLAKVFYLGHGTTNLTGGDGLALFSGSHTIRKTGGTQSNLYPSGDTHRAFTAANLVDALNIMNRFKGMNDVQMRPVRRFRVVCSVELEPTVQQALNSLYGPTNANLGLQTGSAEAFAGRGVDAGYVVLPDIPYSYRNYWSVVDLDRASEMLFYAKGWDPRMNDVTTFEKGTFKNEASTFFGYVFNGWQWVFGSQGSGAAI